jgi:hypothetical protein
MGRLSAALAYDPDAPPTHLTAAGSRCFPPIIRQNIINEWRAGTTAPELARLYHCHEDTIRNIVKAYPRDHSWHRRAIRLYQAGLSTNQVASRLGRSQQGVRQVLMRHGIQRRARGGANFKGATKHDPQHES